MALTREYTYEVLKFLCSKGYIHFDVLSKHFLVNNRADAIVSLSRKLGRMHALKYISIINGVYYRITEKGIDKIYEYETYK